MSVRFKPLKGISKYRVFEFTDEFPGQVLVRKESGGDGERIMLLKDPSYRFESDLRPEPVPAAGLSVERQKYLYKHVRPHVREMYRDVTCPPPSEE